MISGLLAGLFWALDTVIIGIALSQVPFIDNGAIFIAPIVSTFIHDTFSFVWSTSYMALKNKIMAIIKSINTPSGRWIIIGALLGGPVGMSSYVFAIKTIGPGYTAIISSLFPAFGILLSFIFLKEKIKAYQIFGLFICIAGVILLGYSPSSAESSNRTIGYVAALICALSWASEVVILAHGMKSKEITDEMALNIRQGVSSLTFAIILIPLFNGYPLVIRAFSSFNILIIAFSALFGTASYILYYKAIHNIGPNKAMPLDVTYAAWAIVFAAILNKEMPSLTTIIYGLIIVLGSIIAATDFSKIKHNK